MSRKRSPKTLPDLSWFALLDAALVALAGAMWYLWPELGGLPLLAALLPWVVRLVFGRLPFKRTPLDMFFLLFTLTALVGVWAAYDRARAMAKFWLVLDGVLMYYALAGQPRANRWLVSWSLGGLAVALSGYYFMTHNWEVEPAKIPALNQFGLTWMRIRPALPGRALHPNVVAGMTAMLAPFLAAGGLRALRKKDRRAAALAAAGLLFVVFALLMTTSRGAWISLTAASGVWALWAASGWLTRGRGVRRSAVFFGLFGILTLVGIVLVASYPGGLVGLANRLPGPSNTGSRLDLVRALLLLIGDYPITGGGLDAFPGLYARYILVSPSYILEHGHNLFLDLTLEQGLLGGLAAITILVYSGWHMITGIRARARSSSTTDLILWAALTSMLAMSLHGMMDDALYGSRAAMLLWITPAVGAFVSNSRGRSRRDALDSGTGGGGPGRRKAAPDPKPQEAGRRPMFSAAAALLFLLVYAWLFRSPLMAVWQANIGAARMSQIELAAFPTDQWDDGSGASALRPPAAAFERALELDPNNRTAHHRLGLVAGLFREFDLAAEHLEAAYQLSPNHPGIRKSLAYNLVWAGRANEALALMSEIPEARQEMGVYIYWWQSNGRDDLSRKAEAIVETIVLPGSSPQP